MTDRVETVRFIAGARENTPLAGNQQPLGDVEDRVTQRTCEIPGCGKRHNSHGLCSGHGWRLKRHGDPLAPRLRKAIDEPPEVTFERSTPNRGDGCWEWTGIRQIKSSGVGRAYGLIGRIYAHRWSYEHFVGPIPSGMLVRHSCDNPPCVNPAHLSVGTLADNSRDAMQRNRTARGNAIPCSKLTPSRVIDIRARYASGADDMPRLAREYGVSMSTIHGVIHRRTWKHVA